jgi:hypothetical protein
MDAKVLDKVLQCPRCGHAYIHQVWVEVWEREEDATDGIHCYVTRDTASFDRDALVENPSERRQATGILFECEQCVAHSLLAIIQHKGQTFVEWKI